MPGGTGAYSESQGLRVIREHVAEFIEARDGYKSSPDNIFLADGASGAISVMINLLIRNSSDGIMIPIPQYPLYTATIALNDAKAVPYYLNEESQWGLTMAELQRSLDAAKAEGTNVRGLVVINPGNPSGACLQRADQEDIVRFCMDNDIVLFADEVYQANIYNPQRPFTSFKKVAVETECTTEVLSFHSTSKGFIGECGRRGGYMETFNVSPEVKAQIYKMVSINLCSNVSGQVMVDLMVKPPQPGEPSYERFHQEETAVFESLQRRAARLSDALSNMKNVSCSTIDGAMYAFPRVHLPEKAVAAARDAGKSPDAFYALRLLAATGVCVVPGSGFGQREGTYHVRTTFLPPEQDMEDVVRRFSQFNDEFMAEFE